MIKFFKKWGCDEMGGGCVAIGWLGEMEWGWFSRLHMVAGAYNAAFEWLGALNSAQGIKSLEGAIILISYLV